MMEGGGVVELRGVALGGTLWGEVLDDEVGVASFLQGDAVLRGVTEGTKGLALTLRADSTAARLVDKADM